MSIGIPEVFLGVAICIYIWILINRICNCFEQCSLNKSMGEAYKILGADVLRSMIKSKTEKES